MDNKSSDDSVGSDSLDKSLLKKCVVDDVGDGVRHPRLDDELPCCSKSIKILPRNTDLQKTEKGRGDGKGILSETASKAQYQVPKTSAVSPALSNAASSSRSAAQRATMRSALAMDTNSSSCSTSSSNSPPFETKVKQIAQNLMETSLIDADLAAAAKSAKQLPDETLAKCKNKKITLDESSSSSSNSSSEMHKPINFDKIGAPPLPASSNELPSTSKSAAYRLQTDDVELETETDANDENDPNNSSSKKVRFHPEVKEHDGGIRVIPKKKKKSKESKRLDNEMEQDEEDEDPEAEAEDEDSVINLSKIVEAAEEYLKENPLFIDRWPESGTPNIPEGLMEEEDEENLPETEEEEDLYADAAPPENGVERVLGKLTKGGKILYLVRYVENSKVSWESEEFVTKQCPTILEDYEYHRLKQQERLMNYVAKRQKFRQRYTDF